MSDTQPIDPREFRNALGRFATGVTIVTATHSGQTRGMTCNAFMSVSLNPPLVAVSIAQHATMHQWLTHSKRYGVSILTVAQEPLSNHFAGHTQAALHTPFIYIDRMPLIENAAAHLITDIVAAHEAGDHTLFIGRVTYLDYTATAAPLLYYTGRYAHLQ